jgi:rhamnose transport system ATP-binding protein
LDTLLRLNAITKSFGGVRALKGVSFDLHSGEVHAIVGENGAGKSTLIKIITGAHQRDSGTMEIRGQQIGQNDPSAARALGVAVIYQQPALFPDLTVAENIGLRLEQGGAWRLLKWGERRRVANQLLQRVGAGFSSDALVRHLTMPQQQLVEIGSALGGSAKILILDEPTASLSDREVDNLFRVIRELRAEGVGMIYISHRLDELPQIADRVTVLRDGTYITTRSVAEVDRAEMIRLMVGRSLDAVFPKIKVVPGTVVLETRGLSCADSGVRDVTLSVRTGEILGLAGLVGAGRTELARVLFGITPATSGEIFVGGRPVKIRRPAEAVDWGIAYVPEDRRRHGVILEMPVDANTTLAILRRISRSGLIDFRAEKKVATEYVVRFGIKTPSLDVPVGNLSGGNQQKVSLARWLATQPSVIILDEPTQGVDVGAKSEIIMISSELPEVLGMSDRIAVMHDGRIVGLLERHEATQEKVLELALGHVAEGTAAA